MGLTYRGTDLHTANIHLDVHKGYAEPADVRGEDGIILGAAGRFVRPRVKDHRIIELRGWVQGTGATLTDQQQSWRTNTDALMALLDMTLSPGSLVLSDPDLGLPPSAATTLATSAAADDILDTAVAHGYAADDPVYFSALTGGAGLSINTVYYVIAANLGATTFQVATAPGGSAVNFTTDITAGTVNTATRRSLNARCINVMPGPIEGGSVFQRWTVQLEAVGNPPDWSPTV